MKICRSWGPTALFGLGVLVFAAAPAKANLLPFLSGMTPSTSNPGDTTWDYSVSLSSDERIDGANSGGYTAFFTIYDFAGYISGSAVAAPNWTVSVQDVGVTPVGVSVPDDPAIVNLTFTYVGTATIDGTGQVFTGFSADSMYSTIDSNAYFSQQSTKNAGPATGGRDYGAGPESVPMATSTIPEPSTLLMLGTGLALLGARFVARKR